MVTNPPSHPVPTGAAEPLPPLPDGGLATAMPAWLRAAPAAPGSNAAPPPAPIPATDPAGFLTVDDLPGWLRELDTPRPPELGPQPAPPSSPLATAPAAVPAAGFAPRGEEPAIAPPEVRGPATQPAAVSPVRNAPAPSNALESISPAAHSAAPTHDGQERAAAEPLHLAPTAPQLPVTPQPPPRGPAPRGPAPRPDRATPGRLIAGIVLLLLVIVCFLIARGILRW